MTGREIRDAARALDHAALVAVIVALCSGAYPRAARDAVLAELGRRTPGPPGLMPGQDALPGMDPQ